MRQLFQILNDEFNPVRTFHTLDLATDYVNQLKNQYKDEIFYIVELQVVYTSK